MNKIKENSGSKREVINKPNILQRVASLGKGKELEIGLDRVINIDKQLEIFRKNKLNITKAEKIYKINDKVSALIQTQKEFNIACSHNPVNLEIIDSDTINKLVRRRMTNSHLGIFIIGVKALVRKDTGTKALVILYDERWSDKKKAIIASTEIDLNRNIGLFYVAPDYIINTQKLGKIKLHIQSKGFEDFDRNSENLMITTGFLGKASITSDFGSKIFSEDTIEMIKPRGIKMITAEKISAEDLAGTEWNLEKFQEEQVITPQRSSIYEDSQGKISIRFLEYNKITNSQDNDDLSEHSKNLKHDSEDE